jgi:threonyl-tRNA synthetase
LPQNKCACCPSAKSPSNTPGVRAEIDTSNDKIGGKIQNAEQDKVHTMFVIGQKEKDGNSVAIRLHGRGMQGVKPRSEAIAQLLADIKARV